MATHTHISVIFFSILLFNLDFPVIVQADDTLSYSQSISGNKTLVSPGRKFELGFFSPGKSGNVYLGIWYYDIPIQTVVWVANRDNPMNDSSGILKIGDNGNLILEDHARNIVWFTSVPKTSPGYCSAQLLDSGNFVLRTVDAGRYLWESFDHPTDTHLAGMKLGWDLRTGLNRHLTSWRNQDNPSPGNFSYGMDLSGLPQLVTRKNSSSKMYRSGPWNGRLFSQGRKRNDMFNDFVINPEEIYYLYRLNDQVTRAVLHYSGVVQRLVWKNTSNEWGLLYVHPRDECERYGLCGGNSICAISDLDICRCLDGYVPKSYEEWEVLNFTGGCCREVGFHCPEGERFLEVQGVELPDFLQFRLIVNMTRGNCEIECLKNCSCTAYAQSGISDSQSGCMLWYGDLVDIKQYADSGNQNLHIRVTASVYKKFRSGSKKKKLLLEVIVPLFAASLLFSSFIFWKRRARMQGQKLRTLGDGEGDIELPIFDVATIAEATDNFSYSNKIGEGGFGPVFKGRLALTGQEIAVKKLSKSSSQGLQEFMNEVILISKLQHRNLVRLLGCCVQGEERMLIYEYMPNGSLSSFLFDNKGTVSVSWSRRFGIIVGIARGLLYLHRNSRQRIIHRDLKASNVLLDRQMDPKIADFGIARAFRADQLLDKTTRVIGTHGYMSPEYVTQGLFSMKSDVFSFGVLVLEIVSRKRCRECCYADENLSLLGYAWQLWSEGKGIELLDETVEDEEDTLPISEVVKCVQVGLLCVQQRPEDRPTMASVLSMLDSDGIALPQPKQPGFFIDCNNEIKNSMAGQQFATNQMTVTLHVGR